MKIEEASNLIGAPVHEIASVEDAPGGTVITTTDGTALIYVPADTPDAEGKTGLMHAVQPLLPNGEINRTAFPVFANPVERVTEILDKDALLAQAKELGVDVKGNWGAQRIADAIAGAGG